MDVLLFARRQELLDRIAALLESHEVRASTTTDDDEAARRIRSDSLDAVVIGGGVEESSRARIADVARSRDVRVIGGGAAGKDPADYVRDELLPALRH